MELKDAKKLISYARKQGIKVIKCGDLEIMFSDQPAPIRGRKPRLVGASEEKSIPAPDPLPTIDQINEYIYGQTEEHA